MKSSSTAYWHILLKCLTQLCKLSPAKARALIHSYRSRLLDAPEYLRRDIIHHREPWQLAQMLTGKEDRNLTPEELSWYDKMVRASMAEAAVLGTEDEVREFARDIYKAA